MDVKEFLKICDEKHYYNPSIHDDMLDAVRYALFGCRIKRNWWQKLLYKIKFWFRKLFKLNSKVHRINGLQHDFIIFDELSEVKNDT